MTKDKRRRPSSANPTSRPRRIAGRGEGSPERVPAPAEPADEAVEPAPAPEPVDEGSRAEPHAEPSPGPASPTDEEPETTEPETTEPETTEPETTEPVGPAAWGGLVDSGRTTRILLMIIVVTALASLAGGIYLWLHDDDDGSSIGADEGSPIEADDETPIRITGEDAQVAVAAAAQAAYTIVATSYEDYDAQVDEAAELMTPRFAEEYRQTAEDVADAIATSKTEVQVSVVAQGAVRADQEQVQALVFLNQYVTKDGKEPVFTPYRALVTVVNTDQGWLVSDLDTQ